MANAIARLLLPSRIFLFVITLWLITPFIIERVWGVKGLMEKAQFGDQFGYTNSLFSGLALVGVVVALYLQNQQIREQQEEMARQQKLQRETTDALVNSMYARSFEKAYDILHKQEVLDARTVIESHFGKAFDAIQMRDDLSDIEKRLNINNAYEEVKKREDWKQIERQIKSLLQEYNIAGIMVSHGYLPPDHLIPHWEPSIRRTWFLLRSFIEEERKDRKSANHWLHYSWLAQMADGFISSNSQWESDRPDVRREACLAAKNAKATSPVDPG